MYTGTYRAIVSTSKVQLDKIFPVDPPVGILIDFPNDILNFREAVLGLFSRLMIQLLRRNGKQRDHAIKPGRLKNDKKGRIQGQEQHAHGRGTHLVCICKLARVNAPIAFEV